MLDGGPDLHVRWLRTVVEAAGRLVGAIKQLQTEIELWKGAHTPDAGNADLRACTGAKPRLRSLRVQPRHLEGGGEPTGPIADVTFLETEGGISACRQRDQHRTQPLAPLSHVGSHAWTSPQPTQNCGTKWFHWGPRRRTKAVAP